MDRASDSDVLGSLDDASLLESGRTGTGSGSHSNSKSRAARAAAAARARARRSSASLGHLMSMGQQRRSRNGGTDPKGHTTFVNNGLYPADTYAPVEAVNATMTPLRTLKGNVMVNSTEHEFNFLASEQGETYIRINSIPLRFTRTGDYTLEVTQSPWLR